MGISGLLPLLKPIQKQRHLRDYKGQTVAVDAYVWLHRGTYGCATELATGKPTTKYVEYAMHRVRLLKYYGVIPYIVFDGGPLPAKRGTESERKQRRDDNLARGHALAAQGKAAQAREYYCKAIDVTPQMAFQLIKALRAEGIQYVVAPYEADAQLAFLEAQGIVQAILTEDSDLLVFGCQNVLFKLDATTHTVTSVSRSHFGKLDGSVNSGAISLLGWTDDQFRSMAILSGCDYLPSIPGVGLKTAYTWLRKWKTAAQVVRAIKLEGKKDVPKGYLRAFKMAERVFLHQRVYDPSTQALVCLSPLPSGEDFDQQTEAYIGEELEPALAVKVARGEVCPISLLPMEDICPSFTPRSTLEVGPNPAPLRMSDPNASGSGRAKNKPTKRESSSRVSASTSGILNFFAIVPKAEVSRQTTENGNNNKRKAPLAHKALASAVVGTRSGKRTLADVMEDDLAAARSKRRCSTPTTATATSEAAGTGLTQDATRSRFFSKGTPGKGKLSTVTSGPSGPSTIGAGPSRLRTGKENQPPTFIIIEDDDDEITEIDVASVQVHADMPEVPVDWDIDVEDVSSVPVTQSIVTQESGYLSPGPSLRGGTEELSSPVGPSRKHHRRIGRSASDSVLVVDSDSEVEEDVQAYDDDLEEVLSPGREPRRPRRNSSPSPHIHLGVLFNDALTSDIEDFDEDDGHPITRESSPSPGSPTRVCKPPHSQPTKCRSLPSQLLDKTSGLATSASDEDDVPDIKTDFHTMETSRTATVAHGWWATYACKTVAGPQGRKSHTGAIRHVGHPKTSHMASLSDSSVGRDATVRATRAAILTDSAPHEEPRRDSRLTTVDAEAIRDDANVEDVVSTARARMAAYRFRT